MTGLTPDDQLRLADLIKTAVTEAIDSTPPQTPSPWYTTSNAATYLGMSPATLSKYRVTGEGPEYHKRSSHVRYHRDDLNVWMGAHRFRSTSHESEA